MEAVVSVLVGVLFGACVYLMLSPNLVRFLFGMVLIGNAANLLIFAAGGLTRGLPAIVPAGLDAPATLTANPLPQALILTAIVIGFGLLSFALALAAGAYATFHTLDTDRIRVAEPVEDAADPSSSEGEAPLRGAA